MADPAKRWLRIRRYLLDEVGVDPWHVVLVEQAVVRSLEGSDSAYLESLITGLSIGGETRELLKTFTKSLFTDLAANALGAAVT
jgi:hypothetical protein